jgi:hypothetical protein
VAPFINKTPVVKIFRNDHLQKAQRQRAVSAGLNGKPAGPPKRSRACLPGSTAKSGAPVLLYSRTVLQNRLLSDSAGFTPHKIAQAVCSGSSSFSRGQPNVTVFAQMAGFQQI